MLAILEHLRGVITTRHYTNPYLPLHVPFTWVLANRRNVHHHRHFCDSGARYKPADLLTYL